jgi:hypothetical protein
LPVPNIITNVQTAAAINLERVSDWLAGIGREQTRRSAFARVIQPLTAQSLMALIMEFANSILLTEGLRNTQWRAPYYRAAFALQGEWR